MEITLDINVKDIENQIKEMFRSDMEYLGQRFTDVINYNIWMWTDGKLRDIVDTTALRESLEPEINDFNATFTWHEDYAEDVLLGDEYYPGRNWIKVTLISYVMFQYIEKNPAWNSAELVG